jgi:nucleobase:cation symporter-1, NCS1 family
MRLVDHHPDGRVELTQAAREVVDTSTLYNEDLGPVPLQDRHWTTYNYAALWAAMAASVPVYMLASSLVAVGMGWQQAIFTIFLGNLIVLLPILANAHAGTKYGIPFPVYARSSFGTVGANIPAIIRGLIACGWFGIQAWIGGQAIYIVMGQILGDRWLDAVAVGGHPWTLWLSFAIFWALNVLIIVRGMETLRRFENWAAPVVFGIVLLLLVWMLVRAGGLGPITSQGSELGWGRDFWAIFFPSLMGMIAFNATLSLNISDFTRFGGSQRAQIVGQSISLPTAMTLLPFMAVLITSGSVVVFGEAIWDPVSLTAQFNSAIVVLVSLFALTVATLSTNVAANIVSPANDFSNVAPRFISFRTGGVIAAVIAVLIQPWRLLENPETYVFSWMGATGGVLGAIAGVLIVDYWLVSRTRVHLPDLYRHDGIYRYTRGVNLRAVAAMLLAGVLAVGGAYSNPGQGPFPVDGFIPILKPLFDYGWIVGIVGGGAIYFLFTRIGRRPAHAAMAETETQDGPHPTEAGSSLATARRSPQQTVDPATGP